MSFGSTETVVTFLEMTEPPSAGPPAPPARGLMVVQAERPTLDFYLFLYAGVGAPWQWTERRLMAPDALREIILDPLVEVWVLWDRGVPAGYAELDRREPGRVALAYFGLMPPFIGKGYGRFLLDWIVQRAWTFGPARVCVNTCTLDHPNALRNYERVGFRVYERRPGVVRWLLGTQVAADRT